MQYITSRANERIKHIAKLSQSKQYRHEQQECIVEGSRALHSFLDSHHTIIAVYMTQTAYASHDLGIDTDIITIVSDPVMDKISHTQTPSGILGHIRLQEWQSDTIQPGLALINVTQPGNIGTLIRTSVGLGYTTITMIDCADPWNPKAIQASAGTIAHAQITMTDWTTICASDTVTTCVLTAHDAKPIESATINNPLILVGNEAHGIPENIHNEADTRIALRMPGPIESYNAAIAGSIALYILSATKGI